MIEDNFKHTEITSVIIEAFFNVYNSHGYGFLEKVYERSMIIELKKLGLEAVSQQPIKVFYDDEEVGFYVADIIVNGCVVVELKASDILCEQDEAQLTNYLRASEIEVGLLLNFGKSAQFKRKVFSNRYKQNLFITNLKDHNDLRSIR